VVTVQAQKGPNRYLLAALAFIPLGDEISRVSFSSAPLATL
jgi:hypothetical protein